jgi:branched-chain amino acid transport system ATP-binding protein
MAGEESAHMTLLRVESLQKSFGSLSVTRDVTLEVRAGEKHVIIGPNGAGKTSLLNQIGGQMTPDSGRVLIDGIDVTRHAPEQRAQMGLARTFQKNTLFQRLSVFENVRLGVQARFGNSFDLAQKAAARTDINARAKDVLDLLRLTALAERRVASISYGDQRQLEIAVALAGDPRILLLDEPTSGLSPVETRQLIEIIRQLPSHLGILMIEHDMEVVFSLADHITVLYYGEVLASDKPDVVAANERVREVYLGASI